MKVVNRSMLEAALRGELDESALSDVGLQSMDPTDLQSFPGSRPSSRGELSARQESGGLLKPSDHSRDQISLQPVDDLRQASSSGSGDGASKGIRADENRLLEELLLSDEDLFSEEELKASSQ